MATANLEFARNILDDVWALDKPIGQLMEMVVAMKEGPEKDALKECSGDLLSLQYDLIERITTAYPELDKLVEARLPPFDEEHWEKVNR